MFRAVKIRLYPNKTQQRYMSSLMGSYRKVYNLALDHKITVYKETKVNLRMKEIGAKFHSDWTKCADYEYLNEHNTKVLKQAIIDMLDSYKRFFINNSGFP